MRSNGVGNPPNPRFVELSEARLRVADTGAVGGRRDRDSRRLQIDLVAYSECGSSCPIPEKTFPAFPLGDLPRYLRASGANPMVCVRVNGVGDPRDEGEVGAGLACIVCDRGNRASTVAAGRESNPGSDSRR